ncbi:uncharacterized protein EV154DRAFT_486234 [Mucor mucedo]|uniref:uncharacterized protein n=1 Tax=Mucor mucedo TaxID=29922 RepID=UPI0022205215|nr:uncharacterized protein EV154DRAFT_486234 [Mucor mucedo]KAI7878106.1 hypothetical protein EV154DRAFT_486234 [Mucor mucedo]
MQFYCGQKTSMFTPNTNLKDFGRNDMEHPPNSQMELPSLHQPGHTPLKLPSFAQLTSSIFLPARVGSLPLGLHPRLPLINPKPGLFTYRQPDLVCRSNPALVSTFGFPSTSQYRFNASSHNELPVQKVLKSVASLRPVNLRPALRGSPQPVIHSGYEPATEPNPAAQSEHNPAGVSTEVPRVPVREKNHRLENPRQNPILKAW